MVPRVPLSKRPSRTTARGGRASKGDCWAGSFETHRVVRGWPVATGALCVFINRQGAAERWPPAIRVFAQLKRRPMLRRNLAGIIVLALLSTAAFAAQI